MCLLKSNSNNVRHTNESAFRDLQYSWRASADRLEQEREEEEDDENCYLKLVFSLEKPQEEMFSEKKEQGYPKKEFLSTQLYI